MRTAARLAVCCLATFMAAEEDLRGALRDVHAEARQTGAWWTCVQVEAYAAQHRYRISPVLGRSDVIGDALLAFPDPIRGYECGADATWVVTAGACHRLAADGRPLAPARRLPFDPHRYDLSPTRATLGLARIDGPRERRVIQLATMNPQTGEPQHRFERIITGAIGEQWDNLHHGLAVAVDGSALAFAVHRHKSDYVRLYIEVAGKDQAEPLRGYTRAHAIGPDGHWVIADRGRQTTLLIGEERVALQQFARGPGVAVVAIGDEFHWVAADGSRSRFPATGAPIGKRPQIHTVGGWLVLASGDGAEQAAETDIFGEVISEGGEAPATLAVYRWSDLAENPAAAPTLTTPGHFVRAGNQAPGCYLWQGQRLELLDLARTEPERHQVAGLPAAIAWVDNQHHLTRVRLGDGRFALLDRNGSELWLGPADDVWVQHRGQAVVRTGPREAGAYAIVDLAREADQRHTVALEIPAQPYHWLRVDRLRPRAVADAPTFWLRIDKRSGEVVHREEKNEETGWQRPPSLDAEDNHHGPWYRHGGRLIDKAVPAQAPAVNRTVAPVDAVFAGSVLLVLDRDGHLYQLLRGALEHLGQIPADRFALGPDGTGLYLAHGRQRTIVAAITRGPALDPDDPAVGKRGQDLPDDGRWKLDRGQFALGSRKAVWDQDLAWFEPIRMRNGRHHPGLLVIGHGVVFNLEQRAAGLVSSPLR